MFTVCLDSGHSDCEGILRRSFLGIGTLALGGIALPNLLAARAAAGSSSDFVRDKSVVLLYLSGGASHIETFDPKMSAPGGIRSITGEVGTSISGVTFGGTFPRLAAHADKLAVVRSFAHRVGSHQQAHVHVLSGGTDPTGTQERGFSMGSCYARLRGMNHPESGLPTFMLLTEKEIDGQYRKELKRVALGSWPGSLGASYGPFQHEIGWKTDGVHTRGLSLQDANPLAANMRLSLGANELDDRLRLLRRIDRLNRRLDASGVMNSVDRFHAQAWQLLTRGAADAFDFNKEDPRLLERYDTSHIRIGHKLFRPSTLGKQMLVARRLCEAGCGLVTVHSAGWDMHADANNPGIEKGMEMLGRSLDLAVATFLEDLADRGLSDQILLVITGDFGRTPKINDRGGRDHWARLGTLAFAGGGLPMGQVIGRSAPHADVPASEPITTQQLMATIMHTLFDVGKLRLQQSLPMELIRLIDNGQPIRSLL